MLSLTLIQNTKKAIPPSYKMRAFAIKNLVRDFMIISNENYEFSHNFIYKKLVSIMFYHKQYNSYLNVLLDEEDVEWYWVPSELARLYNNDGWNFIPASFPTVLHSDEDDIQGLIKFAKTASLNPKTIKIDKDGGIYLGGVQEWLSNIVRSIGDETIGFNRNRFNNLFGKNKFTVVQSPLTESSDLSESMVLVSLYSILLDIEKELVKHPNNSLSKQPNIDQGKNSQPSTSTKKIINKKESEVASLVSFIIFIISLLIRGYFNNIQDEQIRIIEQQRVYDMPADICREMMNGEVLENGKCRRSNYPQ